MSSSSSTTNFRLYGEPKRIHQTIKHVDKVNKTAIVYGLSGKTYPVLLSRQVIDKVGNHFFFFFFFFF